MDDLKISTTRDFLTYPVSDNDLSPRFKIGDYVMVSPAQPCTPGDEVIVTTPDGKHRVWELAERRDGQVTLTSVRAGGVRVTLKESQIERMDCIVGISKLPLDRASLP